MSKYILTENNKKLNIVPLDDYKDNNEADNFIKRRKDDLLRTISDWIKFEELLIIKD